MMKLIYPDGKMTDEEAYELIDFAAEGRKRVKDQLYVIDPTFLAEPAKFEYVRLVTGETVKIETLENIENDFVQQKSNEETDETANGDNLATSSEKRPPRPRIKSLRAKIITVRENQKGVTYKNLFGDYLCNAKDILLVDPYIRQPFQMDNLIEFIQW